MEGFVDPSFASHFTSPPPNNQPSNTNDLLDFGDSATTSDGFAEFQSPPGGGPQHPQHVVKQVQSLNVTKGSFGGGFSNFDDGTRRPPQYETPTHQKIPSKSQMALHNNLKSTSSSPRIEIFQSQTPPPAMFDRGYSDNRCVFRYTIPDRIVESLSAASNNIRIPPLQTKPFHTCSEFSAGTPIYLTQI